MGRALLEAVACVLEAPAVLFPVSPNLAPGLASRDCIRRHAAVPRHRDLRRSPQR